MDRQSRTRLINELAAKCGRYTAGEMGHWPDRVLLFQADIHNAIHEEADKVSI